MMPQCQSQTPHIIYGAAIRSQSWSEMVYAHCECWNKASLADIHPYLFCNSSWQFKCYEALQTRTSKLHIELKLNFLFCSYQDWGNLLEIIYRLSAAFRGLCEWCTYLMQNGSPDCVRGRCMHDCVGLIISESFSGIYSSSWGYTVLLYSFIQHQLSSLFHPIIIGYCNRAYYCIYIWHSSSRMIYIISTST